MKEFRLEDCDPKFLVWLETMPLYQLHKQDPKILWISYFDFAYQAYKRGRSDLIDVQEEQLNKQRNQEPVDKTPAF